MPQHSVFKPAIVAPTFNNAGTLDGILRRIAALGHPLFVVDDGSTDNTADILDRLVGEADGAGVTVLRHGRNLGKAAAMQTGFKAALAAGFTHALTIDTDGQLDPEQIPLLLEKASANPSALVLGTRDATRPDYPSRSRFGRRCSNLMVRLESGLRVSDSQCGLRVYPLGYTHHVPCRAQRYGYETEILARAGWAGCPVVEVPISCRYFAVGRVSHFRPIVDSARAMRMHARLVARALWPVPHVSWPEPRASYWPTLHSLRKWMSLRDAWSQLKNERSGHTMIATGLAVGVFIANLPVYGAQTLLSLYAARRLHLHPAPVVLGSQISTPPIGLVMIVAAIYVGHLLLRGSPPSWPEEGWTLHYLWQSAPSLVLSWAVGSVLVGLVMAAATFALVMMFLRIAMPQRQALADAEVDS